MSWQQLNDDEHQQHLEEISKSDWDDYAKWLDRERPWWYWIELDENWINLMEGNND